MSGSAWTGRFAPSPTGPLHFGSVATAVASYLDARRERGRWLVRIDDLDPPREQPGAADLILRTLEALALDWDGSVVFQSTRGDAYHAALDNLAAAGHTFDCACSRRDVGPGPYPGTCRNGLAPGRAPRSVRVRTSGQEIVFEDGIQGRISRNLARECGDFVVRRADGLIAYHLAVVVDDTASAVTSVVRGADLLDSTPQQIWLQRLLGVDTPGYAHLPVVLNPEGVKLSKQSFARPVHPEDADRVLFHALGFLGLAPPAKLSGAAAGELLAWALPRWDRRLPGRSARSYVPEAAANIARSSS